MLLSQQKRHSINRQGFTLLEVALSIGILSFGLTAVVSVYMLSLKWAEEIRVDLTALQSGRIALSDAGILLDKDDNSANHSNRDEIARGYVNDYFVVRSYDKSESVALPNKMGEYTAVSVKVYYGGDDTDGVLAHEIFCHYIIPESYKP